MGIEGERGRGGEEKRGGERRIEEDAHLLSLSI